ncbi:hypothetical protein [Bordetella sp. FB-8]|uniref:hypothetical protein n=1 Tax=Bordetella sp. FB-8 TaxID=1159870 RepID=UPI00037FB22E|nr:hypothetical protein [Bordetella sp. FB-8]
MKIFPSLRIAMRILGVCVIAWAALHPAAGASNAAVSATAGAQVASTAAPGT